MDTKATDIEMIQNIGQVFGLHPLVLEDILNTGQRPKLEEFEDYVFIVLKMVRFDRETQTIINEQLSIILGKNYLITFQEGPREIFAPVRERIKKRIPVQNTIASAPCQGTSNWPQIVKVKNALSPIPGASAIG